MCSIFQSPERVVIRGVEKPQCISISLAFNGIFLFESFQEHNVCLKGKDADKERTIDTVCMQ